ASRSTLPGAYPRTGSLRGTGTDVIASIPGPPFHRHVAPQRPAASAQLPVPSVSRFHTPRVAPAGPLEEFEQERDLLGGVPRHVVIFGVAQRELSVRIAEVSGVHRSRRGPYRVFRLGEIDVHGGDRGDRYRAGDRDGGVIEIGAQPNPLDVGGHHNPAG